MAMTAKQRQQHWESLGFIYDYSYIAGTSRVCCDSCCALSINGVPAHETGCPNAKHECAGCNAIIPMRVRYCEDCQ